MNKYVGRRGEEIAADFLREKGYKIIEMNWKPASIPGAGELDIVAKRGEDFIFVEVKAMSANDTFYPEDHFNSVKARKTLRAARLWLSENKFLDKPWQIDLITVDFDSGGSSNIKHYEQAVLG
ncbi:MAG: hypothetical protein A3A97_02320 [Candidatus Terrybacteria bacterium RIFCSPLOWO2_01_FULL_40_23]|uniref:UPF0102 protein A3A97_02320 n=1 Tax=Candidatus Terrybacteria bacterium RIFCSPLOWO2_01_FULL_40_23 TaxID=1802366 RepID=A0A1G2PXN5_9BACT|nr:MAG: hypothetical protein A3A97_02320 [Candidatus Terrybacteria bacterium RIFCSPLOWO2_01_FULL_40_23]